MIFSFAQIIAILIQYKYWFLFFLSAVEGPIITVIAGFLSSLGHLNIFIVYAVIIVGDLASDSVYYAFGRRGGRRAIAKWGPRLGIDPNRVTHVETHFARHGVKTLFLGKLAHGIGTIFLAAAGLAKMPYLKFLFINFLATVIKSLALLLVGFYFGEAITEIDSFLGFLSAVSVTLGLALAIFYFIRYRKRAADRPYE